VDVGRGAHIPVQEGQAIWRRDPALARISEREVG
jgi:hypothetical protein